MISFYPPYIRFDAFRPCSDDFALGNVEQKQRHLTGANCRVFIEVLSEGQSGPNTQIGSQRGFFISPFCRNRHEQQISNLKNEIETAAWRME
jgi:hypothetical protein